jgi:enoyl-CoA hydratase/carnithine racemase
MTDEGSDRAEDPVRYEVTDHVATITLDRPDKLNAINRAVRRGLNAAWLRFRDDEDAWVAVLTGAGHSFCAGADLVDGAGAIGDFAGSFWEMPTVNSFESGWEIWKPTIAAVHGHCIGYGLTGVLACDFVIAADDTRFAYPEVALGTPTIVGAIRLPRRVAMPDALELLLTGETFDAEHAHRIGLAWRVVPRDELLAEAHQLARRLCRGAPLAVRATKEVAYRTAGLGWTDAVRFGESIRRVASGSEDAAEGMQARREGRPPSWRGR